MPLSTQNPVVIDGTAWVVYPWGGKAAPTTGHRPVLWPVALRYMILEWGVWTLIAADEWGDWADPHKRSFLIDLARTGEHRFRLI
ncbi:MAG TPA: hypothetical protein VFX60_14145 [Micromonospora sp.]|nr:hypothetical protein [Micromonospora sp.]